MKPISSATRSNIISLTNQRLTTREIASRAGVSQATVSRVISQQPTLVAKAKPGRKPALSKRLVAIMTRKIDSGELDNAVQVQKYLETYENVSVSAQTVRNALKKSGRKASPKVKKPLLQPRHVKQRLAFCRKYEHWTVDDWKRVLWSDETKVNRIGSDGRIWHYRQHGAPLTSRNVQPTVKHGGGSLMVWGCMSHFGVGNLVQIEGGLDSKLYCTILEEDLAPSVEYYGGNMADFIFQQDNDPKHTSRMAQNWLAANQIEVLDWPPQSPDLNPIEHLWSHLKRKLAKYELAPTSIKTLWDRIVDEWNAIPPEVCNGLIASMPEMVSAVVKAKGRYTKY